MTCLLASAGSKLGLFQSSSAFAPLEALIVLIGRQMVPYSEYVFSIYIVVFCHVVPVLPALQAQGSKYQVFETPSKPSLQYSMDVAFFHFPINFVVKRKIHVCLATCWLCLCLKPSVMEGRKKLTN